MVMSNQLTKTKMSEQIRSINETPLPNAELDAEQQFPWSERIEAIRRQSLDHLHQILANRLLDMEAEAVGTNIEITPNDEAELDRINETLGVTINCSSAQMLRLLEKGGYNSSLSRANVFRRLFSRVVPYNRLRKQTEKAMGIEAAGTPDDPELVFGAVTHDTPRDYYFGGTGGEYGDTILVLKPDRIKDRATFTMGDSLGLSESDIVTWNEVPPLKLLRDRLVNHGAKSAVSRFVEAQIAGGVSLEDIQEIRFMANNEAELEAILNSFGGRSAIESRAPGITISFTGAPPEGLESNAWRPRHAQLAEKQIS
jgi:hypothetical protein